MVSKHLTFSRFVAALLVFIFHFAINGGNHVFPFNHPRLTHLLKHGDLAVAYFFILSGFVMALAYYQPERKRIDLRTFYIARLARIYPIYLISLLLYALIGVMDGSTVSMRTWLLNSLLVQSWVPDATLNLAAWSLSAEMFFYLLFPLFRFVFHAHGAKRLLLEIAALLIAYFLYVRFFVPQYSFFPSPLRYVPIFLAALLVGLLVKKYKSAAGLLSIQYKPYLALATGLVTMAMALSVYKFNYSSYNDSVPIVLFTAFIPLFSLSTSLVTRLFSMPALLWLGNISYSIYILQFPLKYWFDYLARSFPTTQVTLHNHTVSFYAFLLFTSIISGLLYFTVEEPVRLYLRTRLVTTNQPARAVTDPQLPIPAS